jgi:hypothetical protein
MMRKAIVLSLLFMSFVAEAKKMSLEEAKAFLADEKKSVMEDGEPPGRTSQDLAFQLFVADDWKRALTLLENDAPDLRRQNLITVAAEVLPAQDYVRFLNGVCVLMESGKLKMPGWSFCVGSFIKQDFLAYNYDQPEVFALINRIEAIYKIQEQGKWDKYFYDIKSGEDKKLVTKEYGRHINLIETYNKNSKMVYNALVKGHKKLLAEEAKKARGLVTPSSTPQERKTGRLVEETNKKIVHIVDEEGRVLVMEMDEPPEPESIRKKDAPWTFCDILFAENVPVILCITTILIGILLAWYYFKKK